MVLVSKLSKLECFCVLSPRTQPTLAHPKGQGIISWLNMHFPEQQRDGWYTWPLCKVLCQFLHVHMGLEGAADFSCASELFQFITNYRQQPARLEHGMAFPLPRLIGDRGVRRKNDGRSYPCLPVLLRFV